VLNSGSKNVSVINGTRLVGSVNVGQGPEWATVDNATGYVYVSNEGSDNITVINGTKVVGSVGVGPDPTRPAYDTKDGMIYVPCDGPDSNFVRIIKGTSAVGFVTVGSYPTGATYDDGNGYVYVMNPDDGKTNGTVSVINGSAVVATLTVGIAPAAATYDSGNGDVYVANSGTNNVSIINGTTLVKTVDLKGEAWSDVYDVQDGDVDVLTTPQNGAFNASTVINGTTVVGSVALGNLPIGAVYDSGNGYVYVANFFSNDISVINGTRLEGTLAAGIGPMYPAYDGGNGYIYVPNLDSNNVTAIFTGLPVRFTEYGLPAGTPWWVNVTGGPSVFTHTTSLSFVERDGQYTYYVSAADRTYSSPGGSFTITNTTLTLSEDVVFARMVYAITFDETGLPDGTNWSASLGGRQVASVNSTILFAEPNGSYAYVLGVVPGWTTMSFSGPVAVDGTAVSEGVVWTVKTYSVSLGETGLPASTGWWVNLTGGGSGYTIGTSIKFREPNGTYSYSVASTNKTYISPGGSFTVNGPLDFQTVTFFPVTYAVSFVEVGLANGTEWTVGLFAAQRSSPSGSVTFSEPNGTYPFLVGTIPGYATSPSSGSVTVAGASTTTRIAFTALPSTTYLVTFREAGLPSVTTWSVLFHGATVSGRGDIAIPGVANGTYAFSVDDVPGYAATPKDGSITVNGQGVLRAIAFTVTSSSQPARFLGLPATEAFGGLGGVIVAILSVTTAVVLVRRRAGKNPPKPPMASSPPTAGDAVSFW
jgi:DNA-binding beta-propeller fold protein YncE